MIKKLLTGLCAAALLALAPSAQVIAKPKKVKYVPPAGLFGHKWGELRGSFDKLPEQPLGVAACLFIMVGLPYQAWERFGIWLVVGLVLYVAYGFKHSKLRRQ